MGTDRQLFEAVDSFAGLFGTNLLMAANVYKKIGGYPEGGSVDMFLSLIGRDGQVCDDADALIAHKTNNGFGGNGQATAVRELVYGYKQFMTEKNKTTQ
ncbi:MAG: hypothetical protein V1648_01665 [Candidatus Aenigmatarchaeota archaeon]